MAAITLDLTVPDIGAAFGPFDAIEVQRTTTGPTGPLEFLTKAAPASSATLLGTQTTGFNVVGLTFSFLRDDLPQEDVSFTGVNPLPPADVVNQINTAIGAPVASEDGGAIRLTSTITGTASKLEIVTSTALAELGFTAGDRVIGLEERIPLVAGQSQYSFTDQDGEESYLYRVRFINETTGKPGKWSELFSGGPGTPLSATSLALVTLDLVDGSGKAVPGQVVTFFSNHQPLTVEGFAVAVGRAPVSMETDNAGHAETCLVRGMSVRVVFEGTSLIRDFVVPDVDTFDLMSAIASAPDIWNIHEQVLPAAPRRTL